MGRSHDWWRAQAWTSTVIPNSKDFDDADGKKVKTDGMIMASVGCTVFKQVTSVRMSRSTSLFTPIAGELRKYIIHRLFLPARAYRIFPVMSQSWPGMRFRTNNYLEGMHKQLKMKHLRYIRVLRFDQPESAACKYQRNLLLLIEVMIKCLSSSCMLQ